MPTPKQIEAMEAIMAVQSPFYARNQGTSRELFGEWKRVRVMGGARLKMVDAMREAGWLPKDHGYKLTSSGLRELEAHYAKKKYDPTDGRLAKVRALIPEREREEVVAKAAKEAEWAAANAEAIQAKDERNAKALQELRHLFGKTFQAPEFSPHIRDAAVGLALLEDRELAMFAKRVGSLTWGLK
jgi:hypothetical protein